MAFLGQTFDATQVDPSADFEPLPSGKYVAMIVDSDMKETKRGDGQYLALTYQIIDGEFKGRLVWTNLNLVNPNAKAASIAAQNLSAICHAIGRLQVQDSTVLHNVPHIIRVEFVPAGPNRQRDGNEIKAWEKIEGGATPPASSAPPFGGQQQPAQQQKAPAAPGWANKAA